MSNVLIGSAIARGAFDITPNNSTDLTKKAYGITCSGAGTVHYTGLDGVEHTVTLAADRTWPVAIKKVFVTGTTATGIVGFVLFD